MHKIDQLFFSILELLNNSFRAHLNGGVDERIILKISIINDNLNIKIMDKGGGFNPSILPYDLSSLDNDSNIDLNNEVFIQYREKHQYHRFGMGIYISRKTFDKFDLYFVDSSGKKVEWDSGSSVGTHINLTLFGENNG